MPATGLQPPFAKPQSLFVGRFAGDESVIRNTPVAKESTAAKDEGNVSSQGFLDRRRKAKPRGAG